MRKIIFGIIPLILGLGLVVTMPTISLSGEVTYEPAVDGTEVAGYKTVTSGNKLTITSSATNDTLSDNVAVGGNANDSNNTLIVNNTNGKIDGAGKDLAGGVADSTFTTPLTGNKVYIGYTDSSTPITPKADGISDRINLNLGNIYGANGGKGNNNSNQVFISANITTGRVDGSGSISGSRGANGGSASNNTVTILTGTITGRLLSGGFGGSGSGGGGCTLGATASYDLALLLFACMGIMAIRGLRRKA